MNHFIRPYQEIVVARVMGIEPSGHWIESGWIEDSDVGDVRKVYTFDSKDTVYRYHDAYPLTTGAYYIFRVVAYDFGVTGAEIWWDGAWHLLETGAIACLDYSNYENCEIEVFTEVNSSDPSTPYPEMNAPIDGSGVNHYDVLLLNPSAGGWVYWNSYLYPGTALADYPYSTCWFNRYWDFRTPKGLC